MFLSENGSGVIFTDGGIDISQCAQDTSIINAVILAEIGSDIFADGIYKACNTS